MAAPSTHSRDLLRVDTRIQEKCAFLYLRGRLDNQFERIVLGAIESVMEQGIFRVVVDCSGLDYLSSRGVSVFIATIDELRAEGGDLKLAAVSDSTALVLDRLGVSTLIQRFSTTGEAMDAFETPIEEYMADGGLDVFVSSPGGKVFHKSACGLAKRIKTMVTYPSKALARRGGLRPCKKCSS